MLDEIDIELWASDPAKPSLPDAKNFKIRLWGNDGFDEKRRISDSTPTGRQILNAFDRRDNIILESVDRSCQRRQHSADDLVRHRTGRQQRPQTRDRAVEENENPARAGVHRPPAGGDGEVKAKRQRHGGTRNEPRLSEQIASNSIALKFDIAR